MAGGVYFSDYWRRSYVTLAAKIHDGQVWLAEMDPSDYRPRWHCTAWSKGDRVIHQPTNEELMRFGHSQLEKWGTPGARKNV